MRSYIFTHWKSLGTLIEGEPTLMTEMRATGIVLTGILIAVLSNTGLRLFPANLFALCLGIASTQLLTLLCRDSSENCFRRNAAFGVLCCPLLPICRLLSISSPEINSSFMPNIDHAFQVMFLQGSFIASLVVICHNLLPQIFKRNLNVGTRLLLLFCVGALIMASFITTTKAWRSLDVVHFVAWFAVLLIQYVVHMRLTRWLPRSFTLGEAAIVSQGFTTFTVSAGTRYKTALEQLLQNEHLTSTLQATIFVQTAVMSCFLVLLVLFLVPYFRKTIGYYALVAGVAAAFSLPVLLMFFDENFVTWCFNYITANDVKIQLFFHWSACCLASVVIVYVNASPYLVKLSSSAKDSNSKHRKSDGRHVSTTVRKQFHFLAMVVLLPGLLLDAEILFVAASCAFVVLVMLESLRVLRIAPFGEKLHEYLQVFIDDRDEGVVILTHIYLLVGCSSPLWLHHSSTVHVALYSGFLSLGIGDTVANLAGSAFGQHRWPDTKKTVEGTLCSVLAQLIFVFLLDMAGVTEIMWAKCLTAVLLGSLLEAFTTQIDNLLLPMFMYLLLI